MGRGGGGSGVQHLKIGLWEFAPDRGGEGKPIRFGPVLSSVKARADVAIMVVWLIAEWSGRLAG